MPDAIQKAAKTGWNTFPSYGSPEEADKRYMQMHGYMEKDTANYFAQTAAGASERFPGGPTTNLKNVGGSQ